MRLKTLRILRKVNFMHFICDNVVGEDHGHKHRMFAGAVVMVIGVAVAKTGAHIGIEFVAFASDMVGYLIHGFGCVPFVETAVAAATQQKE